MKRALTFCVFILSGAVCAQDLYLSDYNHTVPDVARRGLTKETIFSSMERQFIKLGSSICSNRALIWAYDFERKHQINSAKMFLFYSEKTGEAGQKVWWYHVTPLVNENGVLWALDAGFPSMVSQPILPKEWLRKFAGTPDCKEIKNSDTDLIETIFTERRFPSVTRHGTYDCYYRITSDSYWTPEAVAQNLLQRDRRGRSINFSRESIQIDELMQACMEASSTAIGGIFTDKKKKCREYLGISE